LENEPSNDDDFLFGFGSRTLWDRIPLSGFDIIFVATDVNGAVLFQHLELVKCVQSWSVFDIAG
jgi:hypothetical protein